MLRRALFSLALLVSGAAQPAAAATSGDGGRLLASKGAASAATSGDGERLLAPSGAPLFIVGMNYEGPADRAWQMWDNDKFDAGAIDAGNDAGDDAAASTDADVDGG